MWIFAINAKDWHENSNLKKLLQSYDLAMDRSTTVLDDMSHKSNMAQSHFSKVSSSDLSNYDAERASLHGQIVYRLCGD